MSRTVSRIPAGTMTRSSRYPEHRNEVRDQINRTERICDHRRGDELSRTTAHADPERQSRWRGDRS